MFTTVYLLVCIFMLSIYIYMLLKLTVFSIIYILLANATLFTYAVKSLEWFFKCSLKLLWITHEWGWETFCQSYVILFLIRGNKVWNEITHNRNIIIYHYNYSQHSNWVHEKIIDYKTCSLRIDLGNFIAKLWFFWHCIMDCIKTAKWKR